MAELKIYEDPDRPGRALRIIKCDCGANFEVIDWFMESCPKCNQMYNGAGQKLAPMSQWGEETGESLADIIGPSREDY